MKFLIATHNRHKCVEFRRILAPLGIEAVTAEDVGITLTDAEETGTTFKENARIKAVSGCKESGMVCIADDSGLSVDALDGRPGVYSARYAGGHDVPYDVKINTLLDEMKSVPDSKRGAQFVSAVCCAFPDGRLLEVEGICRGVIGHEPKGGGGFGFDPIFYVGDKSFAQLTGEEKDAVSHRGKSLKLFSEKIADYI